MPSEQLTADVVICGAGIAGIATAYHLTVRHGVKNVVLVDERPPLSLTSDKSTECYRNWFPDAPTVRLMNRSIDLLEELARESGNFFNMNRRGYAFFTAQPETAVVYERVSRDAERFGAGPLRIYRGTADDPPLIPMAAHGFENQPTGADLFLNRDLILREYPFVNPNVVAMLRPRRCGYLSAQQLGMYLLERAKEAGARLLSGRVECVRTDKNRVTGVELSGAHYDRLVTNIFVNAAGPFVGHVAKLLGVELPVFNELHGKIAIRDYMGLVPRRLPLMIWSDPVRLPWSDEERETFAADPQTRWLTEELPAGVHFKTEGEGSSNILLILWTYDLQPREPVVPPRFPPEYPEVVLRGITQLVPALSAYLERMETPYLDGGYYTKTRENRLLACPLPVEGAYLVGALSGYGIMSSQAAAELAALYITGKPLPDYAPAFRLERYQDPKYMEWVKQISSSSGQI